MKLIRETLRAREIVENLEVSFFLLFTLIFNIQIKRLKREKMRETLVSVVTTTWILKIINNNYKDDSTKQKKKKMGQRSR